MITPNLATTPATQQRWNFEGSDFYTTVWLSIAFVPAAPWWSVAPMTPASPDFEKSV